MNIRRSFLALAFSTSAMVASLPAATPQEIFTQMAQPAPAVPISPEIRATALSALALLPVDTEAVIAVNLLSTPCAQETRVSNVAVSMAPGSSEFLGYFMEFCNLVNSMQRDSSLATMWSLSANETAKEVIAKAYAACAGHPVEQLNAIAKAMHLAPVYAAARFQPGQEDLKKEILEQLEKLKEKKDISVSEHDGFIDCSATVDKWFDSKLSERSEECSCSDGIIPRTVCQELANKVVHLMVRVEEDAVVVVVCEDPAEVKLPADPSQSLLAAAPLVNAAASPEALISSAWISPKLLNSVMAHKEDLSSMTKFVTLVMQKMAAADAANKATFDAAEKAVSTVAKMIPMQKDCSLVKPFVVQAYLDGTGVCIDMATDDVNGRFKPGTLRHAEMASNPNTLFYAASTFAENVVECEFSVNEGVDALMDLTKGVALTLNEEDKDSLSANLQFAELLKPTIKALGSGLGQVIDNMSVPCEMMLTLKPKRECSDEMAFALTTGVVSRKGIVDGWQQMLDAVNQGGAMFGMPGLANMLPVTELSLDGTPTASHHMLMVPNVQPVVSLDDSDFVLGTSPALNQQLIQDKGGMPFAGSVLVVTPAGVSALSDLMRVKESDRVVKAVYVVASTPETTSSLRIKIELAK
ncbi:MAG: hypothetical protein J1E42_06045 [Akkermansiaceae bacterium]|nr:hypothetical protein [Akkermansiaceae bacterium]